MIDQPWTIHEEVAQNAHAFQAVLPKLLPTYRGKYALMRARAVVDCFDTCRDAYVTGRLLFATDQLFSIQAVLERPAGMGGTGHTTIQERLPL